MSAVQPSIKKEIASAPAARLVAAGDAQKQLSSRGERLFIGRQDLAAIASATVVRKLITSTPTRSPGLKSTLDAVMAWHGDGSRSNRAMHLTDANVGPAANGECKLKQRTKMRALLVLLPAVQTFKKAAARTCASAPAARPAAAGDATKERSDQGEKHFTG